MTVREACATKRPAMRRRHWRCVLPLAGFALLCAGIATADPIYSWSDARGVTHFSDKPHTRGQKPITLPELQSAESGGASAPSVSLAQAFRQSGAPAAPPVIVDPAEGDTIRDADDTLSVHVASELPPGDALVYVLDGKDQNASPTRATTFEMTGVYRGTHHIQVKVVDASGEPLAASPVVTVYLRQPTVKEAGHAH